jgi:ABC-type transport system involved in cytochrome c biogenesis permease subunit
MLPTLFAGSALGTAIVFVIAVLLAVFARSSLGDQVADVAFWVGVGSLALSILLSLALLVLSALTPDSDS